MRKETATSAAIRCAMSQSFSPLFTAINGFVRNVWGMLPRMRKRLSWRAQFLAFEEIHAHNTTHNTHNTHNAHNTQRATRRRRHTTNTTHTQNNSDTDTDTAHTHHTHAHSTHTQHNTHTHTPHTTQHNTTQHNTTPHHVDVCHRSHAVSSCQFCFSHLERCTRSHP